MDTSFYQYSTKWSLSVKLMLAISLVMIIGVVYQLLHATPHALWFNFLMGIVPVFLIGLALFKMPTKVTLQQRQLRIHFLVGRAYVDLDSIRCVRPISASYLLESMRLNGSGGFFGFLGTYHHQEGDFRAYVTQMQPLLLIVVDNDERLVINLDEQGIRLLSERDPW